MKHFVSRLDRVLRQRTLAERQHAAALGQAMRTEEENRRQLEEEAERLERCGEQIANTAFDGVPAGVLRNLSIALEAAARRVAEAVDAHREAGTGVDNERTQLEGARRDRRAVERLREKQQADWNLETDRKEQNEIDDLTQQRQGGRENAR